MPKTPENYNYTDQILTAIQEANHDLSALQFNLMSIFADLIRQHQNRKLTIKNETGEIIFSHRFLKKQRANVDVNLEPANEKTLVLADPDTKAVRELAGKLLLLNLETEVVSCVIIQELGLSQSMDDLAQKVVTTLQSETTGQILGQLYDFQLGDITYHDLISFVTNKIIEPMIDQVIMLLNTLNPEFAHFSVTDLTQQDRIELAIAICKILEDQEKQLSNYLNSGN